MKSTSGQKFHLEAPPSQPVVSSCHLVISPMLHLNSSLHLVISSCRTVNWSSRSDVSCFRLFNLRALTHLFFNSSCRPSIGRVTHMVAMLLNGYSIQVPSLKTLEKRATSWWATRSVDGRNDEMTVDTTSWRTNESMDASKNEITKRDDELTLRHAGMTRWNDELTRCIAEMTRAHDCMTGWRVEMNFLFRRLRHTLDSTEKYI